MPSSRELHEDRIVLHSDLHTGVGWSLTHEGSARVQMKLRKALRQLLPSTEGIAAISLSMIAPIACTVSPLGKTEPPLPGQADSDPTAMSTHCGGACVPGGSGDGDGGGCAHGVAGVSQLLSQSLSQELPKKSHEPLHEPSQEDAEPQLCRWRPCLLTTASSSGICQQCVGVTSAMIASARLGGRAMVQSRMCLFP